MPDGHARTRADARRPLTVRPAAPRGFCAGVERAIAIVAAALARYRPPVYVHHQIVHDARVVAELRRHRRVRVRPMRGVDEQVQFSMPKALVDA